MQGAAPVAPEPHSQGLIFDPNGPGMGLDVDFDNFDLGDIDPINVGRDITDFGVFNNFGLDINGYNISNFSFEGMVKDAELSLGPRETFLQLEEPDMSTLSYLAPSYKNTDVALTGVTLQVPDASEINLGTSEHHSSGTSNELQAQNLKCKKTDEVDICDILPEGSHRNRNKTARAHGLD